MEKLADGLQKLDEESLLHVVQLVHDNKTPETYAKNDVESKLRLLAFYKTDRMADSSQMASSMSTSTPSQTSSSRCCGTLRRVSKPCDTRSLGGKETCK